MNRRDFFTQSILAVLLGTINSPTQQVKLLGVLQQQEQLNDPTYPYVMYSIWDETLQYGGEREDTIIGGKTGFQIAVYCYGSNDSAGQTGVNRQLVDSTIDLVENAINNGDISNIAENTDTHGNKVTIYMIRTEQIMPVPDYGDPYSAFVIIGHIYWTGGNA